jgi:hypothetical protein
MSAMQLSTFTVLSSSFAALVAAQQNVSHPLPAVETVWSAVVITTFADRIPLLSPEYSVISPTGAQQMYDAGKLFRDRYTGNGTFAINGLPSSVLDNTLTAVMTLWDIYVQQGANAFMSGLYPPLNVAEPGNITVPAAGAMLNDGTMVQAPLGGTQYPQFYVASPLDPNYVFLAGSVDCPAWTHSVSTYSQSPECQATVDNSKSLYDSILNQDVFSPPMIAAERVSTSHTLQSVRLSMAVGLSRLVQIVGLDLLPENPQCHSTRRTSSINS